MIDTEALADLLAEAHAYVQLRAALGLRPDPLCECMVALRDALNMMPAINAGEERRMQAIIARNTRNRAQALVGVEQDLQCEYRARLIGLGVYPEMLEFTGRK